MEFFSEDNQPNEPLKLKEFESYYLNGDYQFLTEEAWELLYQHFIFEPGDESFARINFIVREAHEQHRYSVFFTLRMAEIKCKTKSIDNAIPFLELAKTLAPTDYEVYETAAQIYEHYRFWTKAEEHYKEAYFHGADKFDILFQLGLCYLAAKKEEKAFKVFKKLVMMNPNNEFVLDHAANLVFILNHLDDGLELFKKVINKNPYSETAWHYRGNIETALECFEDAIFSQEMVLAINEQSELGMLGLANVYQEKEDFETAIEWYECLSLAHPLEAEFLVREAECYEKLEQYTKAKKIYRKAISKDLEMAEAWYGIGVCLMEENKISESLYFFKNAYKYSKNDESHYGLSLSTAHIALEHYDEAITVYETLIRIFPEEFEIWLDYSLAYSEQNDLGSAIEILELALFYLPNNHQVLYRLAAIYLKQNKISSARSYLEKALQSNFPDHKLLYIFEPQFKANQTVQSLIKEYKNK